MTGRTPADAAGRRARRQPVPARFPVCRGYRGKCQAPQAGNGRGSGLIFSRRRRIGPAGPPRLFRRERHAPAPPVVARPGGAAHPRPPLAVGLGRSPVAGAGEIGPREPVTLTLPLFWVVEGFQSSLTAIRPCRIKTDRKVSRNQLPRKKPLLRALRRVREAKGIT